MMDSIDRQNTLQHERLDAFAVAVELDGAVVRSEERRVGKECRSRWSDSTSSSESGPVTTPASWIPSAPRGPAAG